MAIKSGNEIYSISPIVFEFYLFHYKLLLLFTSISLFSPACPSYLEGTFIQATQQTGM